MRFMERLRSSIERQHSLVCVGLDPDPRRIPEHLGTGADAVVRFNREIIAATQDVAAAYKPNLGFYLAYGEAGVRALVETRRMVPSGIPVILDAKVGDVPVTAEAYARAYFDAWGFDAVTANPYLGEDSLVPFLRHEDRGVFILTKNSNPGSGDFQDLQVSGSGEAEPLYLRVARQVSTWHARYGTCALVVGATYPRQLEEIRRRCPDLPILVPGIGPQGGDLEATIKAGLTPGGADILVNASRSIIYADSGSRFAEAAAEAARRLRDSINRARMAG